MTPRLSDIARLAGVSKATASRALSGSPLVKEETRQRICQIAQEHSYQPNALAQAMATKRSGIIAFCMHKSGRPYFGHPFFGPILDGAIEECKSYDYHIVVAPADPANTTFDEHFIQDSVDGVILASFTPMAAVCEFRKRQIPLVVVNDAIPTPNNPSIVADDYGGAKAITNHLMDQRGHRQIAFLSDRLSHFSYYLRYMAYLDAHRKRNIPVYTNPAVASPDPWGDKYPRPDEEKLQLLDKMPLSIAGTPLITSSTDPMEGYLATQRMLASGALPSALFAATDSLAFGAMKALREAGLRIPQDMALAGYDDLDLAKITSPPLTTVRSHPYDMGRMAVRELLAQIANPQLESRICYVSPDLVVRQST